VKLLGMDVAESPHCPTWTAFLVSRPTRRWLRQWHRPGHPLKRHGGRREQAFERFMNMSLDIARQHVNDFLVDFLNTRVQR
jgi:hypothetical protein